MFLAVEFVFRRIFQAAIVRQEGTHCVGEERDLQFGGSAPP